MGFPRVIHQIWMQGESEMPEFAKSSMEGWKEKNPGCTHELWDEPRIEELMKTDFSWFHNTWLGLDHMIQRVDTGRLAILYKYGGIAADMDTTCIRPIETLMEKYDDTEKEVVLAEFPFQNPIEHIFFQNMNLRRRLVNNGIQLAKPGSEVYYAMLKITRTKADQMRRGGLVSDKKMHTVTQVGGLALMTNVVNYEEYRDKVELLPFYSFEAQQASSGTKKNHAGDMYSEHHWKASWMPQWIQKIISSVDPKVLKYTLYSVLILSVALIYMLIRKIFGKTLSGITLLLFVSFLIQAYSFSAHGAYISDRGFSTPIPDRLFDLFPDFDLEVKSVAYQAVYNLPAMVLVPVVLYALFFHNGGDTRLVVVLLATWTSSAALRQFTVQVTGLPPPKKSEHGLNVLQSAVQESHKNRHLGDDDDYVQGNTDMIFSGHIFTTSTALLFIMLMAGVVDKLWARLLYIVIMCVVVYLFVSIRLHYSVDMYLGLAFSILIFGYAREFYEDKSLKNLGGSKFFNIILMCYGTMFFSTLITIIAIEVDSDGHETSTMPSESQTGEVYAQYVFGKTV